MLKTLSLILPVLIPSWRFFQSIEPSPRVQWTVLSHGDVAATGWQDFRPLPRTLTPLRLVLRLFWNPHRNDDLFVMSCAERIQQQPTVHSIDEIRRRIASEAALPDREAPVRMLQFRLVFVHREGTVLGEGVVFVSDPFPAQVPNPC